MSYINTQFSGQSTASILDTVKQIGTTILGQSAPKIKFNSSVTPEIVFDLSKISSGKQEAPKEVISSEDKRALKLIRPKLVVKGLGMETVIAPYGEPSKNMWAVVLVVLLASGLIGAKVAWTICSKIPPKKK